MDRSVYTDISKEISLKLPDIDFDSDSDLFDDGEPIKPYIRPPNEILFGTDNDEDMELVEMLRKLPQNDDVQTCSNPLSEKKDVDDSDIQNDSLTRSIAYGNVTLPTGIRSFHLSDAAKIDNSDRIVLSNFPTGQNVQLDKMLDDIDTSGYESSFLQDIFNDLNTNNNFCVNDENNNLLLERLDEMSKKYQDPPLMSVPKQVSDDDVKHSQSLMNLMNQFHKETALETVYLDLRTENRLWINENNEIETEEMTNFLNIIDGATSSEDDSNDDSTERSKDKSLWIENFRRNKLQKKTQLKAKTSNQNTTDVIQQCNGVPESERKSETERFETKETFSKIVTNHEDSVSQYVKEKVEKIKHREELLAKRRQLIKEISEHLDHSESHPLLIHEEISFDTAPFRLIPDIKQQQTGEINYFMGFVFLSSSSDILTMSKVPSPFSNNYQKENFAAFLGLLLRSSKDKPNNQLPFVIIGLQLIHFQTNLQLALLFQTSLSLSKLRTELKKINLRDLAISETGISPNSLSNLPLSNIIRIQPFDPLINGFIWNCENCSVQWCRIPSVVNIFQEERHCQSINVNTTCLFVDEDFYVTDAFPRFLLAIINILCVCGIRWISTGQTRQLVLAIRGFNAVSSVKSICNSISTLRNKLNCSRFEESAVKDLIKYFGPRMNEETINKILSVSSAKEVALQLAYGEFVYQSLHFVPPNDIVVIISPTCMDIGWMINLLQTSCGYLMINVSRVHLSISIARQCGISEDAVDCFDSSNGVCHLLILRKENPMQSIEFGLKECQRFMDAQGPVNQIFCAFPFSESLIDILDIRKTLQVPGVRELSCEIPDAPHEDCEQCSFILVISDELTRHLAQILDQMSHFDLLAVKCLPDWPSIDHFVTIQSQFQIHIPESCLSTNVENSEAKLRIGLIVVRSMYLQRELDKIAAAIKVEKNLIFAYTMTLSTTFRMIGSFFVSSELLSDERRRSSLNYLPYNIKNDVKKKSILLQFPILYSPITTVISISSKVGSTLSKFRKLWFMLTRDGFVPTAVYLAEDLRIHFLLQRPNAIFFLINWTKSHLKIEDDYNILRDPLELDSFLSKIYTDKSEISLEETRKGDVLFMMVNCDLLDSSVNVLNKTKILWNFLDEMKFKCTNLVVKSINGSVVYKLRDSSLASLSGKNLKNETKYLCMLLNGDAAGTVTLDLLRSKLKLLNCDQQLSDGIFLNGNPNEIIDCWSCLINSDVAKNVAM